MQKINVNFNDVRLTSQSLESRLLLGYKINSNPHIGNIYVPIKTFPHWAQSIAYFAKFARL